MCGVQRLCQGAALRGPSFILIDRQPDAPEPPHCRRQHLAVLLCHRARKPGCKWSCANYVMCVCVCGVGVGGGKEQWLSKGCFPVTTQSQRRMEGRRRKALICHRQEVLPEKGLVLNNAGTLFPVPACHPSKGDSAGNSTLLRGGGGKTGTLRPIGVHRKSSLIGNLNLSESRGWKNFFWYAR